MLKERLKQYKQAKTLPELEDLYFKISYDIGFLNSELSDLLPNVQVIKKGIEAKSIAEFDRKFEETEEYILLKRYQYEIKGLEKLNAGLYIKINSQKAELKGEY